MALIAVQVSLLVGANGFGLWHYRTPDAKAVVHAANYFNGIAGQLNVGDFININASDGNEITSVTSISAAGVVVVGAGTAVALAEELAAGAKDGDEDLTEGRTTRAQLDPRVPLGSRKSNDPEKAPPIAVNEPGYLGGSGDPRLAGDLQPRGDHRRPGHTDVTGPTGEEDPNYDPAPPKPGDPGYAPPPKGQTGPTGAHRNHKGREDHDIEDHDRGGPSHRK